MKHIIKITGVAALMLLAACGGKTVRPGKTLKTGLDSFSYTIGLQVGQYMKGSGLDKIDYSSLIKGIEEGLKKDSGYTINKNEVQKVQTGFMMRERERKSKQLKADADKWLAENLKKQGVSALTNKGQFRQIKAGQGASPQMWDTVTFNFKLSNAAGKVLFDSKTEGGKPWRAQLKDLTLTPVILEGFQKSAAGSEFELFSTMDVNAPLSRYATTFEDTYGVVVIKVEFISLLAGKKEDASKAPPMQGVPEMK